MKIISPYEQVTSAVDRCKELREGLDGLESKSDPKEVRSLVLEFQWTVKRIVSICDEYLNDEIENVSDKEIETRIKMEQILEKYRAIDDQINEG